MSNFMNPLPPQAYTKDTLVQAYAWLQGQSDSVKEIATNPDILVSLFLKAKMQGEQFFERPSIQNFKNELRSLAGMIGEFEQTPSPPPLEMKQEYKPEVRMDIPPTPPPNYRNGMAASSAMSPTPQPNIDEKSQQMIQEVKNGLNLSSDSEVLRLLIAIGYQKAKDLYK